MNRSRRVLQVNRSLGESKGAATRSLSFAGISYKRCIELVTPTVIALTAMPHDQRVLPAGMDGLVAKAVCNDELFREIARLRNRIPQSMVLGWSHNAALTP